MIERFGRTERALHWVHATGFFAMLATGLVLYLPALSELVARRNLVRPFCQPDHPLSPGARPFGARGLR